MSLQVPKRKVTLTIHFVGQKSINGSVFLSPLSALHYGEERIIDFLNDKPAFFPFELDTPHSIRIISKHTIISVLAAEPALEEEELGKREKVTVVVSDGRKIQGELIIDQPEYKSRVLDFFNSEERRFFRLITGQETHYVNIPHVTEVIPE